MPSRSVGKLVKIMRNRRKVSLGAEQVKESVADIETFLSKINI